MAKNSLFPGGTPGAKPTPGSDADRLSIQFRFDADTRKQILPLLEPCDAWKEQFKAGWVELGEGEETTIIMTMENCANRFLRNRIKPAGITDQRDYLKALDHHVSSLMELLANFPSMDGTTADFFKFMERAAREHKGTRSGAEVRMNTYNVLTTLQVFARFRLQSNLAPIPFEVKEQKAMRRSTYPRFVLIADLLAAYQRITGDEPMATASNDGLRRVSPAIEFLSLILPPILRASRAGKAESLETVDDQTLRKTVAEVKAFWKEGLRPEIAYAFTNWGDRPLSE